MVIQLPLVFSFPVHFRHSLQALEHRFDDPIVRRVHVLSDLQALRPDHQPFHSTDVNREILHEVDHSTPFSAGELRVFDGLDLLALRR